MYFSVFLYSFHISQIKLTGGSEGHADGVDDGSGSPGDGEEAARQSEDDKALRIFENYFVVFVFIFFFHFSFRPKLWRPGYLSCLLYFNRCCIFNCWCCFCFLQIFFSHHLETVICILHCCFSFIVKIDSSNDSEA